MKVRSIYFILTTLMLCVACHPRVKNDGLDNGELSIDSNLIVKATSADAIPIIERSFNSCNLKFVKNISVPLKLYLFNFDKAKCEVNELMERLKQLDEVEMVEVDKKLSPRKN